MISIFDVLKNQDFRERLERHLLNSNNDYFLPTKIPPLFKYSSFSKYMVKNLITNSFSLSLIATFNDCYDSRISFGDIKQRANEEYEADKSIAIAAGCDPVISIEQWQDHILEEQKAYADFCRDSHCICLSETNTSTLMWSHYSDNNRGICVEYDFEKIRENPLYFCLFPVCYTEAPISVYDFLRRSQESYSIELGVLISVLNKATCWKYEKEWRLILLNEAIGKHNPEKYITANNVIEAKSIILGYNFLDNFIPELNRDAQQGVNNAFLLLQAMVAFIKAKQIPLFQMSLDANTFEQNSNIQIDVDFLVKFIQENIRTGYCSLSNRSYLYISFWEELQDHDNNEYKKRSKNEEDEVHLCRLK